MVEIIQLKDTLVPPPTISPCAVLSDLCDSGKAQSKASLQVNMHNGWP